MVELYHCAPTGDCLGIKATGRHADLIVNALLVSAGIALIIGGTYLLTKGLSQ